MKISNEHLIQVETIQPPKRSLPTTKIDSITSLEQYQSMYKQSIEDPETFFGDQARKLLTWYKPFEKALIAAEGFSDAPVWFLGGEINMCYNAVDRHALDDPERVAIIFESDTPGEALKITYRELLVNVCQTAHMLQRLGVRKGDIVTVYMTMIPETVYTLLAITRLGAAHSVVFAGFSPDALRERINSAGSRLVITMDQGVRAGKFIETKDLVDKALSKNCDIVEHVVVYKKSKKNVNWVDGRDIDFSSRELEPSYIPCVPVNAEDLVFMLFTSGSTGKPKGLQHATAGYMLSTIMSNRYCFGLSPGDVFFCAADIGWITGHSHTVYGPLMNGVTTIVFEGSPVYPTHTRFWEIIDRHKATQLYTAPTAIRLLVKSGSEDIKKFDLSSLRVIATAGEPIAADTWRWFYKNIGRERVTVCDTYWLTESAQVLLTSIPGVTPMKPGAAGLPFFGIKPVLLDAEAKVIDDRPGEGILVLKNPWPSLARTVRGDHPRYLDTYLKPYPGHFFTGDGCVVDKDGYYFITGRVDDVVNVSGHRLSTAEVEASLVSYQDNGESVISESAVVGVEDAVTGQALVAFLVLDKKLSNISPKQKQEVADHAVKHVGSSLGRFAAPKKYFVVDDLPKTRSGKTMRRVLRKIVTGDSDLGELSTLSNPDAVQHIVGVVQGTKSKL